MNRIHSTLHRAGSRPRRRWFLLILATVALMAACDRKAASAFNPPLEGRPFPALKLNYSGGSAVLTQAYRGKLVVLNFWATWCPPCRREMPSLERLSTALDPQRFAVVGISADDDELLASEFLMQNGITFANFFDQRGSIGKQLGLSAYPETFVIGPDGTLVLRTIGFREWDSAALIAQLEDAYQKHQSSSAAQTNLGK